MIRSSVTLPAVMKLLGHADPKMTMRYVDVTSNDLQREYHLARDNDTEMILHEISRELSGDKRPRLVDMMRNVSKKFDGAYSLVLLNAQGDLLIARDPLGIKPLCWAKEGTLFAAASESVALLNLGFKPESIKSLEPGYAITITQGKMEIEPFAESTGSRHCFFEWIYFANVASTLDGRSVYLSRTALGEELARLEMKSGRVPLDEDTIVVPVPDTSKAAADAMAHKLGIPSREGLIRNRYSGRTFIEGGSGRRKKAETKYTPLREVLEGKRIFLVEDSIVDTAPQVLDEVAVEHRVDVADDALSVDLDARLKARCLATQNVRGGCQGQCEVAA